MKNHEYILCRAKYSVIAAVYQPDQGQLRRTLGLVVVLLAVFLFALAARVHAEDTPVGCLALEGGISSPGGAPDSGDCKGVRLIHVYGKVPGTGRGGR